MLSYRHGFHAGNHADVLKHVILVLVLDYLTRKDKPLWYVDTHAGAGVYALDRGYATRLAEHTDGIGRLWNAAPLPEPIARYVALVRDLNGNGALARYPGSPWFARRLLRREDRLWLYELHPADQRALTSAIGGRNVRVAREDGLAALRGRLPPQPRRALTLIDPPYEVKGDYAAVPAALGEALERFPQGTYLIWYPQIAHPAASRLPEQLQSLNAESWLDARLRVRAADAPGMYGSGLFVINPPYTLPGALEDTLPALVALLGQDDGAGYGLDWQIV
ncbi:MAG: 23S rRNA (adenine(2030)-N(6))-methyltransferase RlmJ [Pseudomonadales bacterium]